MLFSVILLLILTFFDLIFLTKPTTFFGNTFRLQGIFLLWLLIVFAFLSAHIRLPKVFPIFFFGILIVQLIATLFIAGGVNERGVGTLGEPNALAAATIFVWPFLLYAKPKISPLLVVSSFFIAVLIIFLSGSRSGMIAFVIQSLFWGVTTRFRLSSKIAVLICFIIMIVSYILPFADQTNSYEQRSDIWNVALAAGVKQPLLGYGFGNTEYALHDAKALVPSHLGKSFIDSSHNIFLDWFVQGGIIGLEILLFLLFQTFWTFIQKEQNRNSILLLGLLTTLSFNPASVVSLVALWWLIGQGGKKI